MRKLPNQIIGYKKNGCPIYLIQGGSTPEPMEAPEGGQQGNPAWNEFLEVVPQELHPKVTPLLQKWDQGVNERFSKVHEEYQPWKPVIDSGVDPETTGFALNLLEQINQNPEMVYNAIAEFYGLGGQPETPSQGQEPDEADPYEPRFAELQRQNEIMAQILMQQHENSQASQADAELDQDLAVMQKKYGQFDENMVLSLYANDPDIELEDAVKHYFSWRENELKASRPKPLIMGTGGSVPGQGIDPKKLDDRGTRNLIVDMLRAHKEQSG